MKQCTRSALFRIVNVSLIIVMLSGCASAIPTARTALQAASLFIDALTLLDKASQLYQSHVLDAVNSTKEQLAVADENPQVKIDLSQVAIDWEQKWQNVDVQTAELEKKFKDVESASKKYWDTLNQVTAGIKDSKLRKQEEQKNREAKQKWDEAYNNAKKQIDRARALRDKGNDFQKLMLASALRRQLAEYTVTLDSIAEEAESLLSALETLTEQGRLIVNPS